MPATPSKTVPGPTPLRSVSTNGQPSSSRKEFLESLALRTPSGQSQQTESQKQKSSELLPKKRETKLQLKQKQRFQREMKEFERIEAHLLSQRKSKGRGVFLGEVRAPGMVGLPPLIELVNHRSVQAPRQILY